jgi:RNA polymerase sigma-70 factor (ECF subfamily)
MAAAVPVTFTDPAWLEEERGCLVALRRGDRKAFERLYAVMAPPLYARVLLPRLGDPQAAEDVLSETFARLCERPHDYEDRGGSVWSWLATIAANGARDLHRARARGGRALVGYESLLAPLVGVPTGIDEAALDGPKLREAVAAALGRVNPRYRRALELRFFEDRERADCAAVMDVKVGTFDVLLLRALRAFRAAWLERTS